MAMAEILEWRQAAAKWGFTRSELKDAMKEGRVSWKPGPWGAPWVLESDVRALALSQLSSPSIPSGDEGEIARVRRLPRDGQLRQILEKRYGLRESAS